MWTDADRERVDDPQAKMTLYVGFLGVIATVVSIIVVHGVYYGVEGSIEEAQVLNAQIEELDELQAAQQKWVNEYRWIDKEKRIVGIPIDQAIEKVIEEERRR